MKAIVGIDFGTSSTVIRYKTEGEGLDKIQSVKDEGMDIIPSVVYKMEDGALLYGEQALIQAGNRRNKGQYITNIKLDLLDDSKKNDAKQLIIGFLRHTYSLFSAEIAGKGYTDFDIYVSYPVKWNDENRTFMKGAVREAGYQGNIFGLNEAQAVARLLVEENLPKLRKIIVANKPMHVMMLDMGAGTTDVVIFNLSLNEQGEVSPMILSSYPSTDNPYLCGGSEIDELLYQYVNKYIENNAQFSIATRRGASYFSKRDAKTWKDQNLSLSLALDKPCGLPQQITSYLPFLAVNSDYLADKFSINRKIFEGFTKSHWAGLYHLIESAICSYNEVKAEDIDFKAEDIDLVFLTGGHSQWYVVPKLFNGEKICGIRKNLEFSKLISDPQRIMSKKSRPQETVACGLCMQDTNIEIHVSTPNNVWAEIIIEHNSQSFKSGITQIVRAGDILPTKAKHIDFVKTFQKNAVFSNLTFGITINTYTGEKLETAQVSYYSVPDSQPLWWRIIFAFIPGMAFIRVNYNYGCSVDLSLREDGTLSVDGKLILDTKDVSFTEVDFSAK